MNGQAARRIKGATSRLENQPYDMLPRRRTPRPPGGATILWCTPTSAISSGANITGQTIQVRNNGLQTVTTNGTVYNEYGAGVVAGKVCSVSRNPDGTFSVVAQSCT